MKKNSIFKLIVLFSVLFTLLSYVEVNALTPSSENVKVRIGYFPNITHSQALVGKADGKFQNALGTKNSIEWKQFNAGPAEIEALFAGEIDIGYIGPGPAISGYTKSKGALQIIAGATDAGAILVTRKDLKLNNISELSGKKVAVPQFGNTQDLSLRNLLKQKGLKDTTKGGTVEILQAENPDIKTLLDKGDIDAALVPEPWGSRLVKEINANVLLDYYQIWRNGKYSTAVVIASTKFIKEHPDLVEKFLRTHIELTDNLHINIEKEKISVNSQIKELTQKDLAKDVLDAAFKRLTITYDPESDSILELAKLSKDAGFISELPDKNLFNFTILNKILKERKLRPVK
jgi:NitT/TauT family transport system substrate-binding protein